MHSRAAWHQGSAAATMTAAAAQVRACVTRRQRVNSTWCAQRTPWPGATGGIVRCSSPQSLPAVQDAGPITLPPTASHTGGCTNRSVAGDAPLSAHSNVKACDVQSGWAPRIGSSDDDCCRGAGQRVHHPPPVGQLDVGAGDACSGLAELEIIAAADPWCANDSSSAAQDATCTLRCPAKPAAMDSAARVATLSALSAHAAQWRCASCAAGRTCSLRAGHQGSAAAMKGGSPRPERAPPGTIRQSGAARLWCARTSRTPWPGRTPLHRLLLILGASCTAVPLGRTPSTPRHPSMRPTVVARRDRFTQQRPPQRHSQHTRSTRVQVRIMPSGAGELACGRAPRISSSDDA